jgi:hypothetical protein
MAPQTAERSDASVGSLGFLWGLIPPIALVGWMISPAGAAFRTVKLRFFGSRPLGLFAALWVWIGTLVQLFGSNPQARIFCSIEFGAIALGVATIIICLRRHTTMALLGLGIVGIAFAGAARLAVHRYILAVPTVFLVLGRLGKHPVFDRWWTMFSLLLMGLLLTLFTHDFFFAG